MTDGKLYTSLRSMSLWLNWPITFNRLDSKHRRLTNTIHLTLKKTSAQVVETPVANNSAFQNYPHKTIIPYELFILFDSLVCMDWLDCISSQTTAQRFILRQNERWFQGDKNRNTNHQWKGGKSNDIRTRRYRFNIFMAILSDPKKQAICQSKSEIKW